MNQQNFGGAVIPAMAGFFLFGKRAKVQEIQQEKPLQLPAVVKTESNGLTGVARYLVSTPLITSVSKYLNKKEKQPITGVAKYVLRQAIADRNAPPATGVSKYLANAAKQPPARKKSGVEKYLAKQELATQSLAALTGVARYEAEQNLAAKKKATAAMVQRYKEVDEKAAKAAREAAEAAYESSKYVQAQEGHDVVVVPAATRVGRYMQEQAELSKKRPKATGVSKYLARQIVLNSQKPAVTISKVGKYLREQTLAQSGKPMPTGVAKYLSKQHVAAKIAIPKAKPVPSGVERYLKTQAVVDSNRPVLSGVAKYMEKQAQLEGNKPKKIEHSVVYEQELVTETATCLEGEFIPASDFIPPNATGVSRYLEKQGAVVTVAKEIAQESVTGVSRYLEKQVNSVKLTLAPVCSSTGVDRYLLNKA